MLSFARRIVTLHSARAAAPRPGPRPSRRIGSRRFTIPAGRQANVAVRPTRRGRRLLARHRRLAVRARDVASDAAGHTHTTTATLTLRRPRRR